MNERGYLDGSEMASTFNMLRANDLIWSFVVNNYLLGKDPLPFDLLYWNSDSTRMPAAMHSFYLRNMYLKNLLAKPGGDHADGRADRPAPDRDALLLPVRPRGPHRAVEIDLCGDAAVQRAGEVRAVGVGPYRRHGQPAGRQQVRLLDQRRPARGPRQLAGGAARTEGSWWPEWNAWVGGYGEGKVPARQPGSGGLAVLEDAPGSYVAARIE